MCKQVYIFLQHKKYYPTYNDLQHTDFLFKLLKHSNMFCTMQLIVSA